MLQCTGLLTYDRALGVLSILNVLKHFVIVASAIISQVKAACFHNQYRPATSAYDEIRDADVVEADQQQKPR